VNECCKMRERFREHEIVQLYVGCGLGHDNEVVACFILSVTHGVDGGFGARNAIIVDVD